ncbi:MAG: hypothetical protein HOQ10_05505 [Frateuria sp.]|uniref:hypothetical protein n=1 Tax=Frateuria sp. TaxID=2211372 RepID=UPI0017AFFB5B|nr:hypothetical protein [Frateuria sp.]NUO72153.1 hypothetical protein [Frateuria sp.]NUR21901.1 hypothetical protein [Frateuria sp.]
MPHPLPFLAAAAAVPLLALIVHAAAPGPGGRVHAERSLPHNLCASCHGGGQVAWSDARLDAVDLMAARAYLPGLPRG